MQQDLSIFQQIATQAEQAPEDLAILAPARLPLTYGRLQAHISDTVTTLNAMGVGRHDRVALVLPNGPELAVAFLAVAAGATAAPLNAAYRADEFEFYLSDVKAKALLIQAGLESPARAIAHERNISVIELAPVRDAAAGIFTLSGENSVAPVEGGFAQPDEVALVLHTSGTTSRPKIVPLTHVNICISAHNVHRTLELVERDRCLSILPLFHTHGLLGAVLSSLVAGASVVCTPGFHPLEFFAWLSEFQPSWYTAVPTIHQAILTHAAAHREIIVRCPLRLIRSSSAPLPPQVKAELEEVFHAPVIDSYGMTEAPLQITVNPLPPRQRKAGSVGIAVGLEVAIADETGRLLSPGDVGEVVIRGQSVMQGYENNPAANQSAFIHGWFRTGDLGYMDAEGYLFITGRLKELINRGGEKISPREVEEVLLGHPAIAQAVTFAIPHGTLGEDVAAAVVLREQASATAGDIQKFVAGRLAEFKVPRQVVIVDEIPQSTLGKVQRIGLAEKLGLTASGELNGTARYAAPQTPVEQQLVAIWSEVLGVESVGVDDPFFSLGGDSILVAQVLSQVRQTLQMELSFLDFLETPTVAGMAKRISALRQTVQRSALPALECLPRDRTLPLSYAQQRLWFFNRWEPSEAVYNRPIVFRLNGQLNVAALEQSLNEVLRRHEVLRTIFATSEGDPIQVIVSSLTLTIPVVDLQDHPASEREAEARRRTIEEGQRPFDLSRGPLVRARLWRVNEEEHIFLLTIHHTVYDGSSKGILLRELSVLYEACSRGTPSPLSALSIQYADFAVWQRQWLQGEVLHTQLAYWQQQLAGAPPALELPTDRPRPLVQTFQGARQSLRLSKELSESLHALSRQEDATLFMTLLAAFTTLLYRYTGQEDILVGTPIANRNRVELEGLIGFFANTLVLRSKLSGELSFRELLKQVRNVALAAYAHQYLPFEKLVEELQPERAHHPLFQVMFILEKGAGATLELPGLTASALEVDSESTPFDLILTLIEQAEGFQGSLGYNTDLFDAATIQRMLGHFQVLLEGLVVDPDQPVGTLPLLTKAERQQLLYGWNHTRRDYPQDQCIHQLFESQAATTPEQIALVHGARKITYREVNEQANQLAHLLQKRGIRPETLVAVCMDRSPEVVIAMLAILKAGGAFVSLDANFPPERLNFVLQDTDAQIVITKQAFVDRFGKSRVEVIPINTRWNEVSLESMSNPESAIKSENLLYVVYTSGSTGNPKGILVTHRSFVNYALGMVQTFEVSSLDRRLQFASLNSESFISEVFFTFLAGATLVLRPAQDFASIAEYLQFLEENSITITVLPSVFWHEWVTSMSEEDVFVPSSLRCLITGMDKVRADLLAEWKQKIGGRIRWFNGYGPAETTCLATVYEADFSADNHLSSVPIGRPLANTTIYLLDQYLNPVPIGVPGELYIGGHGVARGYLNLPELTAERFLSDMFSDEPQGRLYRTGDLACYLPDGNIQFLGRIDHQVKIRGFRVEPGEVETVLRQHPVVQEAVVMAREDEPNDKRLVAYVVAAPNAPASINELRSFLREKLPHYMIPSAFVFVETLPLASSGKVNLQALPKPDPTALGLEAAFVAPRTEIEVALAEIWTQVLGIERIGVYDNFFDLGGHSLLSLKMIHRVEKELGVQVSPRELVTQTLGQLAARCEERMQRRLPQGEFQGFIWRLWNVVKSAVSRGA